MQSGVETVPQIVVEKQGLDCFTNPNLRPLLNMIGADRYVVYGVATEHCVRCAVFGLLETGARVELVTDAIAALSASDEREVVQRFQGRGGHLITTRVALS
ncbi:MAG: isochorismatase family protein [Acidobacteria bacterium]|nr:isochorismatase family protein [Acidobacteriota bacterium]